MTDRTKMIAASILSLAAAAPAWADTYPGMMCTAVTGAGTATYGADGRVRNASTTTTLQVNCPVIRDNNAATVTASWAMSIVDPLASNSSCTLYSRRSGGGLVAFQTQNSIWSTPAQNELLFTPISAEADGYTHFNCTLPVSVGGQYHHINSYRSF